MKWAEKQTADLQEKQEYRIAIGRGKAKCVVAQILGYRQGVHIGRGVALNVWNEYAQ